MRQPRLSPPPSFMASAQKAVGYVVSKVTDDGSVAGVSTGTPIMKDAQAYKSVPVCTTLYGQGLTLLMLCEQKRG